MKKEHIFKLTTFRKSWYVSVRLFFTNPHNSKKGKFDRVKLICFYLNN